MSDILQKLDAGEPIENMVINLSDINFATGTAQLAPRAASYLEKVVSLMQKAPNIDLFIQGHADSTGSEVLNNRLSLDRARSVQQFLVGQGIDTTRLSVKGFGSSRSVADNRSAAGRAQNRRVEMEVLRREEVETIQDIIVTADRRRIGSSVIDYDDTDVRYTQFTSEDTLSIRTERVDTIYFSDGTVKTFPRPVKEKFDLAKWWNDHVPIFRESQAFHRGNFVIGLGIGFTNNVGIARRDHPVSIPPLLFITELPIGHNVGVGLTGGIMRWGDEETSNITYTYYAVSTRATYHFNLGPRLDVYAGVALNGRMVTATNPEVRLSRDKIDLGMLLGVRYYFNPTFGAFLEIGDESVSYAKGGLAIKFGN